MLLISLISQHKELIFMVTIDGKFIPKPLDDLFRSHKFSKVPVINGITSDECGLLMPKVSVSSELCMKALKCDLLR